MGSVYPKGRKLWIGFKDVDGRWRYRPTDFKPGEEAKARQVLATVERQVKARIERGEMNLGPLTVRRYFEQWSDDRERRKVGSAKNDRARLKNHALPYLGHLLMTEVRPRHVRDMVRGLRAKIGPNPEQLAPRTVRHVYGTLHTMFEDAVTEEVIDFSPCHVKRGELPQKEDKDPTWRSGAVFIREEVETLISHVEIPEDRRVLYAIAFMTGMRSGEIFALRWRHYDPTLEPLGKLLVAASYCNRTKKEKSVKTHRPREVPVHSVLAKVLAAWKIGSWERMMGRPPSPDDLIVPSREGNNRSRHQVLHKFHADLDRLGLRRRRAYDSRRSFISLARADGARKDILHFVTHGPTGDIDDLYTTLPWAALCAEVSRVKIALRECTVVPLRKAANLLGPSAPSTTGHTPEERGHEKALTLRPVEGSFVSGGAGNRTRVREPSTLATTCVVLVLYSTGAPEDGITGRGSRKSLADPPPGGGISQPAQ